MPPHRLRHQPKRRQAGILSILVNKGDGTDRFDRNTLTVYGWLLGLLITTLLLGLAGIGLGRPLFILGCIAVAWRALKVSPGMHAEVIVVLFAFAPFLRRIVDAGAGFNPSGIMLVGPLLALAVPLTELRQLLIRRQATRGIYVPYLIMGACLTYAWTLSAFQGDFLEATMGALKMFVPMLYAVYIIQRSEDCEEIISSVTRAFLFITPIIGVYGILQYVNPQPWDRYWMINSPLITSIGKPEPMQIRVFSTMNSPMSFGTFAACGLLLFGFCRRGWITMALVIPISLGLLLSFYRTAWISVFIGVGFCFMYNSTRARATWLTVCLFGAGALAVLTTPFGTEIANRLMTLTGDPAQDGSGHERLQEIMHLYSDQAHYLFGNGLAGAKVVDPQLLGIDGQLVSSAVLMGIFVGNIHILALIWACLQGVFALEQNAPPTWLVAGAVVVANVALLPLAIIAAGEVSFPVWTFAALLTARRHQMAMQRSSQRSPVLPPQVRPSLVSPLLASSPLLQPGTSPGHHPSHYV